MVLERDIQMNCGVGVYILLVQTDVLLVTKFLFVKRFLRPKVYIVNNRYLIHNQVNLGLFFLIKIDCRRYYIKSECYSYLVIYGG